MNIIKTYIISQYISIDFVLVYFQVLIMKQPKLYIYIYIFVGISEVYLNLTFKFCLNNIFYD